MLIHISSKPSEKSPDNILKNVPNKKHINNTIRCINAFLNQGYFIFKHFKPTFFFLKSSFLHMGQHSNWFFEHFLHKIHTLHWTQQFFCNVWSKQITQVFRQFIGIILCMTKIFVYIKLFYLIKWVVLLIKKIEKIIW